MGFIKEFFSKGSQRKDLLRQAEDQDRVTDSINERKKSHGERELIKVLEEEKQKNIKDALYWEGKKRQLQDKQKGREMMKFDNSLFNNDSILKQKQDFLRGGDF